MSHLLRHVGSDARAATTLELLDDDVDDGVTDVFSTDSNGGAEIGQEQHRSPLRRSSRVPVPVDRLLYDTLGGDR